MTIFRICRTTQHQMFMDSPGNDPEELAEFLAHPPVPGAVFNKEFSIELWEGVWTIEISDLNALLELTKEHGIIITTKHVPIPTIEIYDGYRE